MRICVICEGSYPFVPGGVSSWLQELMNAMPQHEFVVWAIGAQESMRGKYAYSLPKNVVHVEEVFLDTVSNAKFKKSKRSMRLSKNQRAALRELLSCRDPDWDALFELLSGDPMRNVEILMNQDFLEILKENCVAEFPYVGFTDYFWTIRSMFLPLLFLMGGNIPEADLYYSVSAGYGGVLGSMAHVIKGKPFMLTEHGIYTREREEEILRTTWVPPHFKDLWIAMFYMFTRCAYKYAARVTSLFQRASLIQQEIGCDPAKCHVVPNGVNCARFSGVPPKQPDGWVDIGAVVRVVPIKDIKTMLYAFANVCADRDNVRLHIMGPLNEDPEYYDECLQLKEDLGLDRAIFTGRVNVVEYLEKIDFTLLTSISEGQPLAVLEAMAAGRPAVTTDVGSCRELLEGPTDDFGPGGLCVPVMHQGALASAMLELCASASQRRQMGENGRNRVLDNFRHETMVARYEALFQAIMKEAGAWRA